MDKFELLPITLEDINLLDYSEYKGLNKEKRTELINHSKQEIHDEKFFKFYKFKLNDKVVGFFNVYEHSKSVISIAPNIIEDCRRKGFGAFGLEKVIEKVRILGYKIAMATIREDNIASIKLHEKLKFENAYNYDKQGINYKVYLKSI